MQYVDFHNAIDLVYDEWLREKRCYSDVSFPKRQRRMVIYDVSYSLKDSEGDNK